MADPTSTITHLIINSPYSEPTQYWRYERETRSFTLEDGRRPAGYVIASERSRAFDDPGQFIEIPLVNQIRPRIRVWRESGYPGVTGITKRLLEHWNDSQARDNRFFFCQLEAIETLIWLAEAPDADKVGIDIPGDGGAFWRICSKMATGSGKTIVMAMLIAWQVLNKVTYPQDTRFSKHIFVVAPGLTVKRRLQVLMHSLPAGMSYYEQFNIVPPGLTEKLRQGKVLIRNWHILEWETEDNLKKKRGVDKRGPMSDEAYVREVLDDMASTSNILVINDEAHHAWRVPAGKLTGILKEDVDEATKWVGGLDRIHRARGILTCYDFSATPFVPSGKRSSEEALFEWIVSDFGLNDAIESGLVKTPRVVIRDDGKYTSDYRSRFYHLYNDPEVKADLTRKAEPTDPLPDLVTNAYALLGTDWLETLRLWQGANIPTPPVMITVANRTETAARIKHAFDTNSVRVEELCDPERTLHIDTKVLKMAEAQEDAGPQASEAETDNDSDDEEGEEEQSVPKRSKLEQAQDLRLKVDTVGQVDMPGQYVQSVISVGMLSEGWDAKTVTHIMGLRAFSSQLLCEQVVGRGLRRTSYEVNPNTGLFDAEYVNIFGVPFTFLPHESRDGPPPPPASYKTRIEPAKEKAQYEISWPNIVRINHTYTPRLTLNIEDVKPLELDAYGTSTIAELAPVVAGKPDVTKIAEIGLEKLGREYRTQKIIFETARAEYDRIKPDWQGNRDYLLSQLVLLVERFIKSDKLRISPPMYSQDALRRRILITLNMGRVVQHLWEAIRMQNTDQLEPVFDTDRPIRSTGDMPTWYSGKPCEYTKKSHINFCIYDSTWEASESLTLDRSPKVDAWVKNDHLGFEILYIWNGVVTRYIPDFIVRLTNGSHLVLETKGQDDQKNRTKREFLDEWVRAVNAHGGFGVWKWDVSFTPSDVYAILERAMLGS